jgi:long-chain acyl-CoA synthetase
MNYATAGEIAYALGAGLHTIGISFQVPFGVYAPAVPEWVHSINASSLYGFVIASLYDTLGADALDFLIAHSRMKGVLVHPKNTNRLVDVLLENSHDLESVIVINPADLEPVKARLSGTKVSAYSLDEILTRGRANPLPLPKITPDDIYYYCYSSGTTGTPKGVIITHRSITSNVLSGRAGFGRPEVVTHYSFLPFAHTFERIMSAGVVAIGGRQMFATGGSVVNISADLAHLQPTVVASVPRIFIRYYEGFMAALAKTSPTKQRLFWSAYSLKKWLQARHYPTAFLDDHIFKQIRATFGPNLAIIITAGAALDAKIHDFLQVVFGVSVCNGFGCSESGTGNICTPDDVAFQKPGFAGGPLVNSMCRIEPVEGYNEPGSGEVLIGGQGISSGYLYDDEATQALFADEAHEWVRTGDVGKWVDGSLIIVDRLRSIFKLAQGEYVAAEMVTRAYEEVPAIEQLYVYGDSGRVCLTAVIIPRRAEIAKILGKAELTDVEFKEACANTAVKSAVLEQMGVAAKARGLFGFQQVKGIHLDTLVWSPDNNLLTPTFKVRRKALADHYRQEIEALYKEIATAGTG